MAQQIPSIGPLLSSYQAKPLLEAHRSGKAGVRSSLDLNYSFISAALAGEGVEFDTGLQLGWSAIEHIAGEERRVFGVSDGQATSIQVFSSTTGWVRTLAATESAPTTLVSGIPMHRIKDTDPMIDTKAKLAALHAIPDRSGKPRILDTATGLGYTAIAAARIATEVVTIELDPAALELASHNPWSQELFTSSKIRQIVGDAHEEVLNLDAGSFGAIIHDPPTLSLAGELYSEEFYRRLYRLLKRGGRLFHYIGDPTSHSGKRTFPGVMKRLKVAGFQKIAIEDAAYGVSAQT